jgi:hypothetical protein
MCCGRMQYVWIACCGRWQYIYIYPMLDLCLSHRASGSTRITENKSSGTGGSSLSNSCYFVSILCWRSNSMWQLGRAVKAIDSKSIGATLVSSNLTAVDSFNHFRREQNLQNVHASVLSWVKSGKYVLFIAIDYSICIQAIICTYHTYSIGRHFKNSYGEWLVLSEGAISWRSPADAICLQYCGYFYMSIQIQY